MDDTRKTKAQIIAELNSLRERVAELEATAIQRQQGDTRRAELSPRLQLVLDSLPLGCIIVDPEWRIAYWNEAAEKIFSYTSAEVLGRLHYEVTVPENAREYVSDILIHTVQSNQTTSGENENNTKAGDIIVCEWHNTPLHDADGRYIGTLAMAQDITARKQAEAALRASEERFRHLFDASPVALAVNDSQQNITWLNHKFIQTFGYTLDDIPTVQEWWPRAYPDPVYRQRVINEWDMALDLALRSDSDIALPDYRVTCKDGTVLDIQFGLAQLGEMHIVIMHNVTERKRAEEALRASEEQYRSVIQTAMDGFWVTDLQGRLLEVNETYCQMSGYSQQELLTMNISDIDVVETAAETAAHLQQLVSQGQLRFITRHRRKDGSVYDAEVSAQYRAVGAGQSVAFVRDITERKQTEEALRVSEKRFRNIFENVPIGMFQSTPEGKFVYVNSAISDMLGYDSPQELIEIVNRSSIAEALYEEPQRRPVLVEQVEHAGGNWRVFETRYRRKDGRIIDAVLSFGERLEPVSGQQFLYGFVQDVTERKQIEEQLRASEERFRIIASSTPDHLVVQDRKLRYQFIMNPQLGLTEQDMLGKTDWDFLSQADAETLTRLKQQVMNSGEAMQVGIPLTSLQGDQEFFEGSYVPKFAADGQVDGLIGYFRNVTERKRAEELLRKSEEKFSTIFKTSPESITIASLENSRYLEVNDVFLKKTGFRRSEVIGHTSTDLGIWVDPSERQQFIEKLSQNGSLRNYKARYRMRSGEIRFFEVSSEIIQLEGVQCRLNFITDVTEHKQADEALQVALTKYKTLFDSFPLGITVSDQAGQITETNATAVNLLAVSEAEHTHRKIQSSEWQLIRPDGSPMPTEEYAGMRALNEHRLIENVEMGFLKPDGSITWLNVTAAPLPLAEGGVVITYNDITARKQMEEALRESEEKYRNLFENMNDAFALQKIILDENGRPIDYEFLDVNPVFANRAGMNPADLIHQRALTLFPKTEPAWIESFGKVALTGRSLQFTHYSIELDKHYETRIYCPRPGYFAALFTDITERKQAEEALRQATERLELAQNLAGVGVWDWNVIIGTIEWTPQMFRLFGLDANQSPASFETWRRIVHPEDLEVAERRINQALQNHINLENEYRVVWPNGQEHWIGAWGKGIYDDNGQPLRMLGICVDITARKRAEEQLFRAQKLESLGILAGGVAHDFNNLLVALLGQTSLAAAKLPPDHPAQRHLERALVAAKRAADLTRQMLAYSGRGAFQMMPLNLNLLIQENLGLFESTITNSIALRADLAETLPLINADAGQMQQIIMNLVLNAAEAMSERGGLIKIATSVAVIAASDGRWTHYTGQPVPAGRYVQLQVQDAGHGMSAETLGRIFDPFFTTKFTGRGLGLAAVLGIVRGHRGGLWVESEVGRGTIFTLIFPVTEEQTAASETASHAAPTQQIVLVIDDEEPVLEAIADMLALDNIATLCAVTALEGIALYRERQADIGLVLLDLSMPGMGGRETFEALKQIDPEAHIVLTSGYTQAEATRGFEGRGLTGFLYKPYDMETLLATVRQHLKRKVSE